MKKLFSIIFFMIALAFCVFMFLSFQTVLGTLGSADFTDPNQVKAFIIYVISLLPLPITFLTVAFSFISFIIHVDNKAKAYKGVIKCANAVGGLYTSLFVCTTVGVIFNLFGTEGFFEALKLIVTNKDFYIPAILMVAATIFLIIGRFITRGGPISGVFVAIGMAVYTYINVTYFFPEGTSTTYQWVAFFLCLGASLAAVIPAFMPSPSSGPGEFGNK